MGVFKEFFNYFRNVVIAIVKAIIIAIILRIFVISIYYIPSSSMENTLKNGDSVFVWKFLYNYRIPLIELNFPVGIKIKRGDILVFIPPKNPEELYVKRCIGLPSDKIEFDNNKVIINNNILNEVYIKNGDHIIYKNKTYTVPDGHIFVLGDNRLNSSDSRDFGFVPIKNIIGKAILIIYPFNRIRILK